MSSCVITFLLSEEHQDKIFTGLIIRCCIQCMEEARKQKVSLTHLSHMVRVVPSGSNRFDFFEIVNCGNITLLEKL